MTTRSMNSGQTEELIEKYASYLRAINRVPKTIASYCTWVRRFFEFASTLGIDNVGDVTAATIHAYQKFQSQHINKKGRINTVKVQNQHVGAVGSFFKFLSIENSLPHNPAHPI